MLAVFDKELINREFFLLVIMVQEANPSAEHPLQHGSESNLAQKKFLKPLHIRETYVLSCTLDSCPVHF